MPLPEHIDLPSSEELANSPEKLLQVLNKDKTTNLDVAYKIAINIRKPTYTLRNFHDDLVEAFPELTYYMIAGSKVSSGGTPVDEYLRARRRPPAARRPPLGHKIFWIQNERRAALRAQARWARRLPSTG